MRFLKRKYAGPDRWKYAWEGAIARYNAYLKSIADRLPADVLAFQKLYLHDQRIRSVRWLGGGVLEVDLSDWRLWFFGTTHYVAPWDSPDEWETWEYDELELLDERNWQLSVAVQSTEKELVVRAQHVAVFSKPRSEWVVPPPPKASDAEAKPKKVWARHRKRKKGH